MTASKLCTSPSKYSRERGELAVHRLTGVGGASEREGTAVKPEGLCHAAEQRGVRAHHQRLGAPAPLRSIEGVRALFLMRFPGAEEDPARVLDFDPALLCAAGAAPA